MKRSTIRSLILPSITATALCMASCATVFTGTRQRVAFASIPSGARVQVNGIDRGTTPMKVKLKKGHTGQVITISAQGYESRTFQPETNFNAATLGNIILFPCFGIDLLTGAMWKYHPKKYNIELERRK